MPERLSHSTEVTSEMIAVETPTCFLVVLLREKADKGTACSSFIRHLGTRDENVLGDSVWGRGRDSPKQVDSGLRLASAQEMADSSLRT